MKRIGIGLILLALAGCGAAGDPWQPTANVGMTVGSGGVSTTTTVGATNGPFTISVGG